MVKFLDDAKDRSDVLAYLITYHTYGTWLHGDERGSVDEEHNRPGTTLLPADVKRNLTAAENMAQRPVALNETCRTIVERTICEVASHRGWTLHALNVRTNHVHLVISANATPEKVMNDLKSWSTRRMVEAGLFEKGAKAWVRHGSTKYLWDEKALDNACRYVLEGQGIDL
ncbi:MAG TPA: transposase [Thermoguttaceae bacterium]|nr:transposase [Thermoguttaceae bacterium]